MRFSTVVKVVKIAGTVLNIAGMLASNWAGDKEQKIELHRLVKKMNRPKT